jgi:hypothetical protein
MGLASDEAAKFSANPGARVIRITENYQEPAATGHQFVTRIGEAFGYTPWLGETDWLKR